MKHYINPKVITSFLRAGRIEKRGVAIQLFREWASQIWGSDPFWGEAPNLCWCFRRGACGAGLRPRRLCSLEGAPPQGKGTERS